MPDLEDDVLESYEEHHVADLLVMELANMKPDDERFTAKTTVLIENVRHHIEEVQQARKKAPRRPSQPSALKKTIDAGIS